MSSRIFRHSHRVTYAECTMGNHVYFARYLDLLEEARGEFFRSLGAPLLALQEQDTLFPVVEAHLKYRSPARYDEVVRIELWVPRTDRVRLYFNYLVTNETSKLVLEAAISHVCTTLAERPKRIPGDLMSSLAPYAPGSPAEGDR